MPDNSRQSASPNPPVLGRTRRYLFMILLGFVFGIIVVVMGLRALEARKTWQDHYPSASMQLLTAHSAQLRQLAQAHRCTAVDVLPHLQMLRHLGNELEPAFSELGNNHRFIEHAGMFRSTLDAALASPPQTCEQLGTLQTDIGATCKGCHQDFR